MRTFMSSDEQSDCDISITTTRKVSTECLSSLLHHQTFRFVFVLQLTASEILNTRVSLLNILVGVLSAKFEINHCPIKNIFQDV